MTVLSLDDWNAFYNRFPEAHLLQSAEWGELKSAFGWEAVRIAADDTGAQILFRRLPMGMTFGYIPKGPLCANGQGLGSPVFWQEVDALCRARKAIFLKVEPDRWVSAADPIPAAPPPGFVFSPQHVQPRSTLVVDLSGSEEEVFERMKPKTRYNIRLAGRKEVQVRTTDDLQDFYNLMEITSRREQFHVHSLDYYRRAYELFHPLGRCELFVAQYQGRTLAAVMVFASRKSGYYFYGASGNEERNRKPTYPLQWEAIRWAYHKGCSEYDMWGIPDDAADIEDEEQIETREEGLWGVYRFKRGFGGMLRKSAPALDRVYNPLLYKLYLWRFSGSGSD
jgi:lipid II:glycine glycyltransferase (peptidoglycan interpeptide bridge formation enzyme)